MSIIFWLRQDLRLLDNTALQYARQKSSDVHFLYIFEETHEDDLSTKGAASQWFLSRALRSFQKNIEDLGGTLLIEKGDPLSILDSVAKKTRSQTICWNRRYDPYNVRKDQKIKQTLQEKGIEVKSFKGSVLFEPWEILNQKGEPFKVFTPFWRHCLAKNFAYTPYLSPSSLKKSSIALHHAHKKDAVDFSYDPFWSKNFSKVWEDTPFNVSEQGAHERLDFFLQNHVKDYQKTRDFPALESTSKLSPYLHLGMISPDFIMHRCYQLLSIDSAYAEGIHCFLSEIGWREFSSYLLYHYPDLPTSPLRKEFLSMPWEDNPSFFDAWKKGQTGYPIVDAGMRQLWQEGWMHNRVRMIVASFLIKDLFMDWRKGERWFFDTLVDADLASNSASWQWVAGCGADAAPYFRVFNPTLQGEKFDPEGHYIKRYVPELSLMPVRFIHDPSKAPHSILQKASVVLGKKYPYPIVDHKMCRQKALEMFKNLRGK